jgi:protocatechuate 3,4-dioxygenase beta subunit
MNSNGTYAAIILGLVAFSLSPAAGQSEPRAKEKFTCRGTVVNAEGKPVNGADVVAYIVAWSPIKTTLTSLGQAKTQSDGTFAFSSVRGRGEEFCMIVARKSGLAIGWINWSVQENHKAMIRLGEPIGLKGRVCFYDGRAKPIKGAEVRGVFAMNRRKKDQALLVALPPFDWLTARSDAKGEFTIEALPQGAEVRLCATAQGYAALEKPYSESEWFVVGEFRSSAWFSMTRAKTFKGKLLGLESGAPVGKIRLAVGGSERLELRNYFPATTVVTKEDGTFTVTGLGSLGHLGKIQVVRDDNQLEWAVRPNWLAAHSGKPGTVPTFTITQTGGCVEVKAVDADTGRPIAGARIDFDLATVPNLGLRSGQQADHYGRAMLRVPAGKYRLRGSADLPYGGSGLRGQIVDITAGGRHSCTLKLAKRPTLTGVVSDPAGKPLSGANVKVSMSEESSVTTDRQGRFEVHIDQRMKLLHRTILVRHIDRGLAAMINVSPDKVKVDIQTAKGVTVTGRIVSGSGRALPIVKASLSNGATIESMYGPKMLRDSKVIDNPYPEIDKDGRYKIRAVPIGHKYVLMADARGHGANYVRVDLRNIAKGRVVAKDVVLSPADRVVAGVVLNPSGVPVINAKVRVVLQRILTTSYEKDVLSDAKGRFRVNGVVNDNVLIQVTSPGKNLRGSVEVKAGKEDIEIKLHRPDGRLPRVNTIVAPTDR